MKLRIRGDSVRLRLSQGDVATLLATGAVEEATHFPGGAAFRYRLGTSTDAGAVDASFVAGTLEVRLPHALAAAWGRSDEVGLEATLAHEGRELRVLIEKDFPCPTSRPGEDDSDAFPQGGQVRC